MYKLSEFSNICNSLSKKNFTDVFTLPLLLIKKRKKSIKPLKTDSPRPIFETVQLKASKENLFVSEENIRIFDFKEVQHRLMLVSVGRSPTNCICLKDTSISKFHAYFKKDSNNDWSLVDAGSCNGTEVNGTPLESKKIYHVKNNDLILFGPIYCCTFFSPETCYEYVMAMPHLEQT